jgi:hypothetical protein
MLKHRLLVAFGILLGTAALAQAQEQGHRGPQIVSPANGATVSGPVTVAFGFGERPDGQAGPGPGPGGGDGHEHHGHGPHLVLFVDAPPPQPGTAIPADAAHVAFPEGEKQVTVTLAPGKHTLQLVMQDREGNVSERGHPSDPTQILVK